MPALLLDTNALIWFLAEAPMKDEALHAIAAAQAADVLFVSPVSAWEVALALRHRNPDRTGARLVGIGMRIALEAARVPEIYGYGDPGDCYLIATARVRRLAIVTRDLAMGSLAEAQPDYLDVIAC